jgi:hypothetical protein
VVIFGLGCRHGGDSSGAGEDYRHEHTEDKTADMGEECNMTATGLVGVDQRAVAFEQLEQNPEAEVEPRRDPGRKLPRRADGEDARTGIEHDVGAQHGCDRAASAQIR